ncbi:MAG TPA: Txe/YoeB family addiction module toxin [Actinoplanes sp.]
MNVAFDKAGWEDYTFWVSEPKTLRRINRMIDEALRDPGHGIGKPERLTENLSGYWSRRITDEHRLVYTVRGENLIIVQARYHY